jgi:hypothetical protein
MTTGRINQIFSLFFLFNFSGRIRDSPLYFLLEVVRPLFKTSLLD